MADRALARVSGAAVQANCALLHSKLGGRAQLCAVVKAGGYGHGAAECARAALRGGATWIAIATADEAAELRAAGIDARLLVMGAMTRADLETALRADADIAAWTTELLDAAGREARVHVKFDSGMGRLGTKDPDEAKALCDRAADGNQLAGVWTHFATVDLVRCGVAIYGLDPFQQGPDEQGLTPALSLHSYVAAVKRFEPGESAGYGRRWRASEPTWVGTIPIGYGDGWRRGLTNNADVLVRGRRHPLVGTVSMDNVTIDLGSETDVEVGDEVVLIGRQGDERILAEEVAERLGTINYEVTCGIGRRVRYLHEG